MSDPIDKTLTTWPVIQTRPQEGVHFLVLIEGLQHGERCQRPAGRIRVPASVARAR